MVRSSASCFKIITCGSDSVDNDDLQWAESKGSTDKRGWSFRRRSVKHRVLSNTVMSEAPSTGNKESPESTTIDFHPPTNLTVPEKISVSQGADEPPQLSTTTSPKVPDPLIASDDVSKVDPNLEESVAIFIQTAIRGYLSRRALLKLKNVIKLQAAVRGHLVRRQAVGSLRCVQAIIKMQALVRARRARMLIEAPITEAKPSGKHDKIDQIGKGELGIKTYSSTEKLLSNVFVRQLLQSTSKTKPIYIKCDPSKPNSSAWRWLEMWMAVLSSDFVQPQTLECLENQEQGDKSEKASSEVGTEIAAEAVPEIGDLMSATRETETPSESEDSLITYDADNFDFHACHPTSSSTRDGPEHHLEDVDLGQAQEALSKIDSPSNHTDMQLDATSQKLAYSASEKPEMNSEQPKNLVKRVASEQLETEGKKFVFGSRKASNPAFVAAQSKFEELSLTAKSGNSISSTRTDFGVESKWETISSLSDPVARAKELNPTENSVSHDSGLQIGGSECGTELSITSTLDSPDRSDGGGEFENEAEVAERVTPDPSDSADHASKTGFLDVEVKPVSSTPLPTQSYAVSSQPGKNEDVNGESLDSIVPATSPMIEQQPERSESDVQIQLDTITDQQAYISSPEGSPRSHITAPESHGTPSSQVSLKAKRNKVDKSRSIHSLKSQSAADKRSPVNHNHDSGVRNSTEQLPKEPKSGKRRNSFGSTRPDHIDQERRDSSSSNSLPNYMQATESARAKAQTHSSPRSSPDVQDKNIYIKKRHSLPGANGKQDSPRMQRSVSQAQQGVKGNGAHSPHERRWQR
ncbi:PREDICTED: protein IQ-DOMAIN 32-like [Nelumbo nucifera]|uniref:Protein IQ-DOMAIN 32-like n=1 Tax=Nelumbo nucifera TaxID=4432 RepID=A0A1U8AN68_NELNU|nr:PREDICTED: protein IQ-DOMAIN 32-like [Nelumbo nucifera]